jgi:Putative stress-responsive transcriptional regulator
MAKRLYKSPERKLSGVCSGIAEYFGIDPTIVRLIWVVFTCVSVGAGLIAYIICAFIMPDRPSSSADWDNMRRANDYSEADKEFNSHFEKK